MFYDKMTPPLKWAGGKSQLLDLIRSRMPESFGMYYEPFVGGGSVVLNLSPGKALINDSNIQLMNLYTQLKDNHEKVMQAIAQLDAEFCDKDIYMLRRACFNSKIAAHELDEEAAALFIWLNKHCFNGLYRVNSKGLFNVPYNNRHSGKSFDAENLAAIAHYLSSADIRITCSDFEEACTDVQPDDFVYFDSPYVPISQTASFTDYTQNGFTAEDHERLAVLFARLDKLGAKLMLSNNDVPLVHDLYRNYNIQAFDVKRMINSNASKRTGREVLITNY